MESVAAVLTDDVKSNLVEEQQHMEDEKKNDIEEDNKSVDSNTSIHLNGSIGEAEEENEANAKLVAAIASVTTPQSGSDTEDNKQRPRATR